MTNIRIFEDVTHSISQRLSALHTHFQKRLVEIVGPSQVHRGWNVLEKDLEKMLEQELPQLTEFLDTAFSTLTALDGELTATERAHCQQVMRLTVQPYFLTSPFAQWITLWPFRYPGDFRAIEMIFEQQPEGVSPMSRLLSRYLLNIGPSRAHRERVPRAIEHLHHLEARFERPLRILSVACGPERALRKYLEDGKRCTITLLDLDANALSHCRKYIQQLPPDCQPASIEYVHLSVRRLMENAETLTTLARVTPLGKYDAILVMGLLDYLTDDECARLLGRLETLLAPAGSLLLTNLHDTNPWRSVMEYVGDWSIIHRNETDFGRLVLSALPNSRLDRVEVDRTRTTVYAATTRH